MPRSLLVLTLLVACSGAAPEIDTSGVAGPRPRARPTSGGRPVREVLVGQLCPAAANQRPAVRPMFLRGTGWLDRAAAVARPLERSTARQFSRLGWDGRLVGLFSVVGGTELAGQVVAIGSYAGGGSCEKPAPAGTPRELDPACVAALGDCGLAVSVLEPAGGVGARPFEEDADPPELSPGGACVAGGVLAVDVDGDGTLEHYDASDLVSARHTPGDELAATSAPGVPCAPVFAQRQVVAGSEAGLPGGVDLIAAIDLDQDGRLELVFAFHDAGRVTWAMYGAIETPARLERLGEAVAWPAAAP